MNRGQTVVPSQGLSTQWIEYNTNIKKSLYGPIDGKTQTRGCLVVICHSTSQLRFDGFFYNQMPMRAILKRVLTSFVFICYSRKKFFALRVSLLLFFFFKCCYSSQVDLIFIVVQISFFICNGLCTADDLQQHVIFSLHVNPLISVHHLIVFETNRKPFSRSHS